MCPFCIATAAILAGSTAGTSGIAAAVTGVFLRKKFPMEDSTQSDKKEVQDGNDNRNDAA